MYLEEETIRTSRGCFETCSSVVKYCPAGGGNISCAAPYFDRSSGGCQRTPFGASALPRHFPRQSFLKSLQEKKAQMCSNNELSLLFLQKTLCLSVQIESTVSP